MKLFVAHFVIRTTEQGLVKSDTHTVRAQLFYARDAADAYDKAQGWIPGFEDSNNDGRDGGLTTYACVGLHQLEEVSFLGALSDALNEMYGIEVGSLGCGELVPLVRQRHELEVFRAIPKIGT